MLIKINPYKQLTLPQLALISFPGVEYFEAVVEVGRIVLTPVPSTKADAVRAKLANRGLSVTDVADAVVWARRNREAR